MNNKENGKNVELAPRAESDKIYMSGSVSPDVRKIFKSSIDFGKNGAKTATVPNSDIKDVIIRDFKMRINM